MDSPHTSSPKICTLEQLLERRHQAKDRGERVVHCHGCFDIVHPGHVRHLNHARGLGDRLVVTLTADEFVNKGAARPMFAQSLRAENLAALSCVDWVLINPAPTAADLLSQVRPDVYVKGAEYENNEDPRFEAERDAVEKHGGRVVFTSGDVVFSSTAIVEAIRGGGVDAEDSGLFSTGTQSSAGAIAMRNLHQRHDLSPDRIEALFEAMRGRRVVIVGESIVDVYVDCAWPEVSGESPALSLRPRHRVSFDGGASVIARHLAAMGAKPSLVTPLPNTADGRAMSARLGAVGVAVEPVFVETPLPVKERFLVGREKIVKLDHTKAVELDHRTRLQLIETVKRLGDDADAAIVVDFGLGMIGPRMAADLFGALRTRVDVLSGDVSGARSSLSQMNGADWLTPSERELRGSVNLATESLPAVAAELMARTRAGHLAVTMADEGMVVFTRRSVTDAPDGQAMALSGEHIPALNMNPMDTLGCGDALLALSTLAQVVGVETGVAAYIGSLAAAVCASKIGNHACQAGEMIDLAHQLHMRYASRPARESSPIGTR